MPTFGNLSKDEFDKLMDAIRKDLDDQLKQQPPALMGTWGQLSMFSTFPSISPTDKDSKGRFPYQEPEQDEQGTYYGYKVLNACSCGCGLLESPRYPAKWEDGQLQADREPSENTMYGIHCTKRPDNPELGKYIGLPFYSSFADSFSVLVQCALSGTIVETEQGFRAEHATITGVFYNGNWTSYQDYQERTAANSRRNTWEEVRWRANYDDPIDPYTYDNTRKKKGGSGKLLP